MIEIRCDKCNDIIGRYEKIDEFTFNNNINVRISVDEQHKTLYKTLCNECRDAIINLLDAKGDNKDD